MAAWSVKLQGHLEGRGRGRGRGRTTSTPELVYNPPIHDTTLYTHTRHDNTGGGEGERRGGSRACRTLSERDSVCPQSTLRAVYT
jgi:hypothetical protein